MIKNLIFETGCVTIIYSNNSRLKIPTSQFVEAMADLVSHAALDTGVHGSGADVLATDADVATAVSDHAGVAGAHHAKYTDEEAVAAVEAEASLTIPEFIGDLTGNADTATDAVRADGVDEAVPVNAVAATLETNLAGANNDLKYTAQTKGVIGNDTTVEYVDPELPSQALAVPEVVGQAIVINLATDAGTKATGTLAITGVVVDADTEIVTLDGDEVYEFDWNNDYTAGRKQVDISGKASVAKAKGTGTVSGVPTHDETFVIDADTFTLKRDGSSGAHLIDLSQCATAAFGIGRFGVGSIPADQDTITINGRVYEFDSDSTFPEAAGDVVIDINGVTTVNGVLTAIAAALNGDGSAVVDAVANLTDNYVEVTAKLLGTLGNYAVSESCGAGGWLPNYGAGGTLVNGADPTVVEVVDQVVADFDGTTCAVTKKDADQFYVEYGEFGTAGNSIVFTEDVTGFAFDGAGVLGGTTTGADCSKADAKAALIAAINAQTAKPVTASDGGGDNMTLTYDDYPYTGGNTFGTTEGMANGNWTSGATLSGGVDAVITSTAALVEAEVEAEPTAAALVAVENKAGNDGSGIVTAMAATNLGTTVAGVDGTVGDKGDVKEGIDTGTPYLYVCIAANTTAGQNWRRVSLGSAY